MGMTFLTGGARSGKSSLALNLARSSGRPVTFIATAEARDDEMSERIAAHRAERPEDWSVIEEPIDLLPALELADVGSLVVIDCLTLWVANVMEGGWGADDVKETSTKAAALAAGRRSGIIVVTNEVGSGIVPMSKLARDYQDLLGAVNSIWAAASENAYLVVAGRALLLDPIPAELP